MNLDALKQIARNCTDPDTTDALDALIAQTPADPLAAERERIAAKLMNTAGEVERHRMPGLRMQAANRVLEWIAAQLRAGRY